MNSLVGVIIRFRQDKVALAADIEAMFHQVRVREDDCDALRFLWWPNGNLDQKPKIYCMNVHLFGATSSPSCTAYALKRTARDYAQLFDKEVALTVERNFYVDDCLKYVPSEQQAIKLATDLQSMKKMGGFRLTKWLSNRRNILNAIPESERASSVVSLGPSDMLPSDKALGVIWDVNEDKIKFKVKLSDKPLTRRGILSIVSSIFDSFRLVSPVPLRAKAIVQHVCKEKVGWDEQIPQEYVDKWKNSTIVIGYIRNTSRRFETFVANRLSVIQNTTSLDQWRHVDSKQNPADIASRGIDACDRQNLELWLNGPKFLHKNSEHWPRNVLDEELGIAKTDTEIKKEIAVHATTNNAIDNLLGYFSDWIKLRRAIAWFGRFKIYCRNRYLGHHLPCNSGNLNVTELREATYKILAHVQMSYFSDEITNLKKAKPVKKGSRIASLNPVLVNELIRSKGRLNYDLSTCPVILPNTHHVTTLIIRYYHETTGHVGKQQVLAASREKYWILKGSSAVKTVIDRCVPCKRQHGPFCKQQMAPLLEEQMTADKPPFTFVGVD
ncbi:uncharacterized protein [Mytilus edulis]|uniref:uncharacterized protein n=1 Tax=Mytilus edulis TaxID=6550 RepID=UPI0039F0C97F